MTPTITVRQARDVARRWVDQAGRKTRGFAGAFLHGSINWLTAIDPLPATSDVDVILIIDGATPPDKIGKIRHEGVLLDVSSLPFRELSSAEDVLSQYHLAGSFAGESVIADPTGRLTALQAAVSRDYAKRHWVRRRCEHARDKVLQGYAPREVDPLADQVIACLFPAAICCHLLLVAGLRNPTVRNRYLPTRELLAEYGRLDLYEVLLGLLGAADLDAAAVRRHFAAMAGAFAAAAVAPKPAFPFAADISDTGWPVAVDGSRELIDAGYHREAVFWIAVTFSRCMKILDAVQSVAPAAEIEHGYQSLLNDLGLASFADRMRRRRLIEAALPRIWEVAEAIMETHPAVDRSDEPAARV